jgi:hypothetical protein
MHNLRDGPAVIARSYFAFNRFGDWHKICCFSVAKEDAMSKPSRLALTLGLAGALAGVKVGLPSLIAAERDPDAAGVAEAIRFEKAKQAAADRQARIEEAREHGAKSADRGAAEPKAKAHPVKSAAARKTAPAQHN